MRLAAYQFDVTGDVQQNMEIVRRAVKQAAQQKADLIVFPECALSGYPPRNIDKAENIDKAAVEAALKEIRGLSDRLGISIIVGTAFFDQQWYNRQLTIYVMISDHFRIPSKKYKMTDNKDQ